MSEPIQNLIVDGVEHPVTNFSEQVQGMLKVRQAWADETDAARMALMKSEAALRQLDSELTTLVTKELNPAVEDVASVDVPLA